MTAVDILAIAYEKTSGNDDELYTPWNYNRHWLHKMYFRGRLLVVSGRVTKMGIVKDGFNSESWISLGSFVFTVKFRGVFFLPPKIWHLEDLNFERGVSEVSKSQPNVVAESFPPSRWLTKATPAKTNRVWNPTIWRCIFYWTCFFCQGHVSFQGCTCWMNFDMINPIFTKYTKFKILFQHGRCWKPRLFGVVQALSMKS